MGPAVLDAIRRRRPEQARQAMEALLSGTQAFLELELAGSPAGNPSSASLAPAR
jgi:DNA-binding FadR family transcriptional regulator